MDRSHQQGQILVETALVGLIVMFILLGALNHFSLFKPHQEKNQLTGRTSYVQKNKYFSAK